MAKPPRDPSRRRFLAHLAAGVGAAAIAPATAAAATRTAPDAQRTVAVLVPDLTPGSAGDRWLGGLHDATETLRGDGFELRLATDATGSARATLRARSDRLIARTRPDAIAAFVGLEGALALREAAASRRLPLLASGGGANAVRAAERDPWTVHHTLLRWQAAWALGRWSGARFGGRALIVATLYDSGFDHLATLASGLRTGGAHDVDIAVTDAPIGPRPVASLIAELTGPTPPDQVLLLASGTSATRFVRAFAAAGLAGRIPLLAGPAALSGAALEQLGDAATGVWSVDAAAVGAVAGPLEDPFARLGYDAGLLLGSGARGRGGASTATVDGPAPLALRRVERVAGRWRWRQLERIADAREAHAALTELEASPRSGWTEPYLVG